MSYTNQVVPGSSAYSTASVPGNSYQIQTPRMPSASPYGSPFQENQPEVEYNWKWNSSFNGDYKDAKLGVGLADRWYCEMCNVELPNDSAWQLVSDMQYLCSYTYEILT